MAGQERAIKSQSLGTGAMSAADKVFSFFGAKSDFAGLRAATEMANRRAIDGQAILARAGGQVYSMFRGDNQQFNDQLRLQVERQQRDSSINRIGNTLINMFIPGRGALADKRSSQATDYVREINDFPGNYGVAPLETSNQALQRLKNEKGAAKDEEVSKRIASNKEQFYSDPQRVSERHQQQTYFQVLFNDRLSRSMEWSAF